MALDFPANPIDGQVYDSYVYSSTIGAWQGREESATVATISPVFPTSANPGDIWYDNDDGTSYIYYDDGTSAQWVELLSSGVPLLDTKASLVGDNSFSDGVNYFGDGGTDGTFISSNSGRAQFSTNNTGLTPLTIRGTSGQTVPLQEWRDSSNAVLARVTSDAKLSIGAASTPLEKVHATGRVLGTSESFYSTNIIGTSIGPSSTATVNADIDMRRWTGTASSHGTGRIEVDSPGNMIFYTDSKTTNTYATTERLRINSTGATFAGGISATGVSATTLGSTANITNGGFDFILGNADQSSRGNSGSSRALVKMSSNRLFVNYGADFAGGTVIDSALSVTGRISAPAQPSFYAQGSGTVAVSGAQHTEYIPLDSASVNIGGHYSTATSRFTAPVAGVYYFWAQGCTTSATSTGPEIYLYKNGTGITNAAIAYDSAFYNTFGASVIVSLAANDYVQMGIVNNNGTSFTIEKGRSRFAGHLIG